MARVRTTGITETRVDLYDRKAGFFDPGGARSERKKWINCLEHLHAVVFAVDIAAYDQVLFEEETVNRALEDLTLFESIINSHRFIYSGFILLFTKMDKLGKKLKTSPFDEYFTDFEGDRTCVEDVRAYIGERFLGLNKAIPEKHVEVIYTSFTGESDDPTWELLDCLAGLLPAT